MQVADRINNVNELITGAVRFRKPIAAVRHRKCAVVVRRDLDPLAFALLSARQVGDELLRRIVRGAIGQRAGNQHQRQQYAQKRQSVYCTGFVCRFIYKRDANG